MTKCTTKQKQYHYAPRAPLVALGIGFSQLGIFRPVAERVQITQKVVMCTPVEKLKAALIIILAGARGLAEAHKRMHLDRGL